MKGFDFDLCSVIPARLGSSRVKNKVFQTLDGSQTLLTRKIKQLRLILPEDRVIVSTESEIIAGEAAKAGATVIFRDEYFADGHKASFSEVITHVVGELPGEYVAWNTFVCPFQGAAELEKSFMAFKTNVVNGDYDSLVSVVPMAEYIWDSNGPVNYNADRGHTISQDLPKWFRVTNGNYMAAKRDIMEWQYLLGHNVYLDVCPSYCGVDIDTYDDLQFAKVYESMRNSGESS